LFYSNTALRAFYGGQVKFLRQAQLDSSPAQRGEAEDRSLKFFFGGARAVIAQVQA